MECKDFQEGLATLAEGGLSHEATAHTAGCPTCATRLDEMRRLVTALGESCFAVPPGLTARAKSLMRPTPRRFVARLLGSSLAGAGTRLAGADGFTLHVGAEELSVRLQYSPAPEGWEVLGRVPGTGWSVVFGAKREPVGPQGRFRILVPSLERSGFGLHSPTLELEVPPAGGTDGSCFLNRC